MPISKRSFGEVAGTKVDIFTLKNDSGMTAEITNYGGAIVSLWVKDRKGNLDDVTLGYDRLEDYVNGSSYFGALIGRHANRIEDARFELNGQEYLLAKNDGDNHLHGGNKGFDKVVWQAEVVQNGSQEQLKLTYHSKDGEENYPGNLDVTVIYSLTKDNALRINYWAKADQDTVVNLTNHAYFNLAGQSHGSILGHELMLNADEFTPIDNEGIPTGEIRPVNNTPMDFRSLRPIKDGLSRSDEQISCGKGYDHNWVLKVSGNSPEKAAELFEPECGRVMEVFTTKPGIQFYSGNFLDGSQVGKNGVAYAKRSGLCLETQYFPNALKHKHFPSPILRAGVEYRHTTIYRFSTR